MKDTLRQINILLRFMNKPTIDTYNEMANEYDDETVLFWDEFPSEFMDKL